MSENDHKTAQQAKQNRERFPQFAAWLATVRAFDAACKVVWCVEGDQHAGAVPPGEGNA